MEEDCIRLHLGCYSSVNLAQLLNYVKRLGVHPSSNGRVTSGLWDDPEWYSPILVTDLISSHLNIQSYN